jgi:peptide/nickel transport system ATP-binding protein
MGCVTWRTLAVDSAPLLSVRNLSVSAGARQLVKSVSFDMHAECIALVGESGSGKSLTARAIMGLLPRWLSRRADSMVFEGHDLLALRKRDWASIRGSKLSLILQDPRQALNPVLTVRAQIDESLRLHTRMDRSARMDRIMRILDDVGLDPRGCLNAYPHELSGGMGQRVMLAMMLINQPRLLIADEPTSALDVDLVEQVMGLIVGLARKRGHGVLLISHDLHQVAKFCDRVFVMYDGRIVDRCAAGDLARSNHPYTRALWSCRPSGSTFGTLLPVLQPDQLAGI